MRSLYPACAYIVLLIADSPSREPLPEICSSPGLKRKLLASQVTTPSPERIDNSAAAAARVSNLTKPRTYSPPPQRRAYAGPRAGITLTKPGSPDVSGKLEVQSPASSSSLAIDTDCTVPPSTSPQTVHRTASPTTSPVLERKLAEETPESAETAAAAEAAAAEEAAASSPASSRTSSPLNARRILAELKTDNEPQFV